MLPRAPGHLLRARVEGGTDIKDVRGKVLEPQSGRTITADGVYAAPSQAGTQYGAAVGVADPAAVASVAVTVTQGSHSGR